MKMLMPSAPISDDCKHDNQLTMSRPTDVMRRKTSPLDRRDSFIVLQNDFYRIYARDRKMHPVNMARIRQISRGLCRRGKNVRSTLRMYTNILLIGLESIFRVYKKLSTSKDEINAF